MKKNKRIMGYNIRESWDTTKNPWFQKVRISWLQNHNTKLYHTIPYHIINEAIKINVVLLLNILYHTTKNHHRDFFIHPSLVKVKSLSQFLLVTPVRFLSLFQSMSTSTSFVACFSLCRLQQDVTFSIHVGFTLYSLKPIDRQVHAPNLDDRGELTLIILT